MSRLVLRTVFGLVSIAALGLPGGTYLMLNGGDNGRLTQHGAPTVQLDPLARSQYEALGQRRLPDQPLVLSYHDVRPAVDDADPDDIYTVTPEQLAEHMAMLSAAGFYSITSAQFVDWLEGAPLEPGAVLITFDDGTSGLWRHADAILEEHGYQGVVFVITGRAGTHRPYYLSWAELSAMAASGRWDMQSHTALGHDRIPIDADGSAEPFLINRRWIAEEQRLETRAEFEDRVAEDLDRSVTDLVSRDLGEPLLFAYPFSAERRPTNDEQVPGITAQLIDERFDAALTNVQPDRLVSERDRTRGLLPRIEAFSFTTAAGLFERIGRATPMPVEQAAPLADAAGWVDTSGRPLVIDFGANWTGAPESPDADGFTLTSRGLELRPSSGSWVAARYAPGQAVDWRTYQVDVDVEGLGQPGSGSTASVFLHADDGELQVAVSSTWLRVTLGRGPHERILADQRLPDAERRTVTAVWNTDGVYVAVDDQLVVAELVETSTSGGVGVAALRTSAGSEPVVFSRIELTDLYS